MLTSAVKSTVTQGLDKVNYEEVADYMDYIYLMSYDYNGAWSNKTGHNSPLFDSDPNVSGHNIDAAVTNLISRGVAADKIVPGAAFYGRSWAGVSDQSSLPYATGQGAGKGTWEPGVLDYKDIAENYIGVNGFETYYDQSAKASYLYNGDTFISYDSPRDVSRKAQYVSRQGLGGVMFWETKRRQRRPDQRDSLRFLGRDFAIRLPHLHVFMRTIFG